MNPGSVCFFFFSSFPLLGFPVGWFVVAVELLCDGSSHLVWASGGRAGFSASSGTSLLPTGFAGPAAARCRL